MTGGKCGLCLVEHQVMVPVVHSNGTAGVDLLEALDRGIDALEVGLAALERTAPNGRDYYLYPDGHGAMQRAVREHELRKEKVLDVAEELVRIREHVVEAGRVKAGADRTVGREKGR